MLITVSTGLLLITALCFFVARAGQRANRAQWNCPFLNSLDGLNRLFCRYFHRLQGQSLELPQTDGAIVVCNHVSGLDPLLLVASSDRPLRFLIAHSEFERWWLKWLFTRIESIPIKRGGRVDRSLAAATAALRRGEVLAVFPQGRLVVTGAPAVQLKRGAVYLADQAQVPIIPVRIEGVAGEGRTILAVFQRSRVRLYVGQVLAPSLNAQWRQQEIERYITTPIATLGDKNSEKNCAEPAG